MVDTLSFLTLFPVSAAICKVLQCPKVFCTKGVVKTLGKFAGKDLLWSFNNVACLRAGTLWKRDCNRRFLRRLVYSTPPENCPCKC